MKKSLLLFLMGALMALALPACSGDSPQAGDDDSDAGHNEQLDRDRTYSIVNRGPATISLGHDESAEITLQVKNDENENVAEAVIDLSIEMSASKSASFSSSKNKTTAYIETDEDGFATAILYSSDKNATGTITATLRGFEDKSNQVTISVAIDKEGEGGTAGTQGSVAITVNNTTPPYATNAEIYIKEIENSAITSNLCNDFFDGIDIGETDYKSISLGQSASTTFRYLNAGKKVVAYAYGIDSQNNPVASACVESNAPVSASVPLNLVLNLEATAIDYDQNYDVLLGLHLREIMPDDWQKWFDLLKSIFVSPSGTAAYYLLSAIPSFDIAECDYKLSEILTGGKDLVTLTSQCNMQNNYTDCPAIKLPSCAPTWISYAVDLLTSKLSPYKLLIEWVDGYLENIEGFDYKGIQEIGTDIVAMAEEFDVGSRFEITENVSGALDIRETWTHVVWTWRYKQNCSPNDDTCGRHAFKMSDVSSDSVVNLTYQGEITKDTDVAGTRFTRVTLPEDHEFPLKYGALIKMLINKIVVPQVMGSSYSQGDDLGDLLDYWIKCDNLAVNLNAWITDQARNNTNSTLRTLFGVLDGRFEDELLAGYCQQGLDAAVNAAMKQLTLLEANANLIVPAGSSFKLTDLDTGNMAFSKLYDLEYGVYWAGEDSNGNTYGAGITGEGRLAPWDCEKFLILSPAAAQAACGN